MKLLLSMMKDTCKTGLFIIFIIIVSAGINRAYCAEQVYYSIHFSSFKHLKNANAQVNSLKVKGKMVFWKKTNVPQKGEYYRVYLGKYKSRAAALVFWEKLKKAGSVSYRGIHKFIETYDPGKIEYYQDVIEALRPDAKHKFRNINKENRFVDNHDGTITDRKTNLMWIKNGWRLDFVSAVKLSDAIKKCTDFGHGGYTDWLLPTIKEWNTLIDTSNQYPAMVEPNPFVNIIVHMPYWSKTELKRHPGRAYTVMLYSGKINHQNKKEMAFILPVRAIDK